jgi:uncharacterized repeat protein (TIGR01451 family)
LTGASGLAGATGSTGASALAGATGLTGPSGLAGATGSTGASGLAGATGLTGASGLAGATGLTGASGLAGATGLTGTPGAGGPAGPAGVTPAAITTTLCVTNMANRGTVRQGGSVKWTIVVTNCGQRAAAGVSVTDRLRKGASLVTRGGGRLVRGQLRWNIGILAPGASRSYEFLTRFGKHARAGKHINRATAVGENTGRATGQGWITVYR